MPVVKLRSCCLWWLSSVRIMTSIPDCQLYTVLSFYASSKIGMESYRLMQCLVICLNRLLQLQSSSMATPEKFHRGKLPAPAAGNQEVVR